MLGSYLVTDQPDLHGVWYLGGIGGVQAKFRAAARGFKENHSYRSDAVEVISGLSRRNRGRSRHRQHLRVESFVSKPVYPFHRLA